MTYLELCVRVRKESGVSGDGPATVINQQAILGKIVQWVKDANIEILRMHRSHLSFLKSTMAVPIVAGKSVYQSKLFTPRGTLLSRIVKAKTLGGEDLIVVDFNEWLDDEILRLEDPCDSEPKMIALSPNGEIHLHPKPKTDFQLYLTGYSDGIELVENADVPTTPEIYHDAILQQALIYYADYEEDQFIRMAASTKLSEITSTMAAECLPRMG